VAEDKVRGNVEGLTGVESGGSVLVCTEVDDEDLWRGLGLELESGSCEVDDEDVGLGLESGF